MKKFIVIAIMLVGIYYMSAIVRAELAERRAEKHMVSLLSEISSPWSAERVRRHCSEWLCTRSRLTPEELTRLADQDLGTLQEIIDGPECVFQSGYERGKENEEIVWAMCNITARFEKETAKLEIRLVEEPRQPPKLFGILGESLKLNDIRNIEIVK